MLPGFVRTAARWLAAYHGASPTTPQVEAGAGMSISWPVVAIAVLAVAGYLLYRGRSRTR